MECVVLKFSVVELGSSGIYYCTNIGDKETRQMSRSVAQTRQNGCLALSRSALTLKIALWPELNPNLAQSGQNFLYGYYCTNNFWVFPFDIFPAFAHGRRILYYFTNQSPSVGAITCKFCVNFEDKSFAEMFSTYSSIPYDESYAFLRIENHCCVK